MKCILSFAIACIAICTFQTHIIFAQTLEIKGFASPECVVSDGEFFYVSNLGLRLAPSEKDGDGFIAKVSKDGKILADRWIATDEKAGIVLHSPKGMVIVGKILYVTDIDRVLGFDLNTREKVFELDFSAEKTLFLNDITARAENKTIVVPVRSTATKRGKRGKRAKGSSAREITITSVAKASSLFVSATDIGKIFEIELNNTPSYKELDIQPLAGPNGLAWDAKNANLYVVGFGKNNEPNGEIGRIHFEKNERYSYEKLSDSLGYYDGVALNNTGKLITTDWVGFDGKKGIVKVFDFQKHTCSILSIPKIFGPADFWYDARTQSLWIPKMLEQKVLVQRIPQ